jgi:hypothetical protein
MSPQAGCLASPNGGVGGGSEGGRGSNGLAFTPSKRGGSLASGSGLDVAALNGDDRV